MSFSTYKIFRRDTILKNIVWYIIGIFFILIIGNAIAETKWLYFGILLAPLLICYLIKKPFIFPFGLYVFLLPFDSVLSVMGSSRGATLTKFLGILTILVLFLKGIVEKKLKCPDKVTIWWILFVSYGIFSIVWAIDQDYTLARLPTAVGLLVLYLLVSSYKIQRSEFDILKWFIFIGGFLGALLIIYNYEVGSFYHETSQRASLSIGEREANPNEAAFTLLIPISVCMGMILKQNKKMMKGLFVFLGGVMLLAIILTGSRGVMLGVGMIYIVYFLSTKQKITTGTILVAIGIVLVSLIPDLYVFFFERWATALETGGSGRLTIWYVGLKALEKYWLMGAGFNNFPTAYNEFVNYVPSFEGMSRVAHSIYLSIFVELGIVGFFLMILAMLKHYHALRSRLNNYDLDEIMLKAAFWASISVSCFGDRLWNKSFWLLWMLIIMYRNISPKVYFSEVSLTDD